jgi:hypothetical protein
MENHLMQTHRSFEYFITIHQQDYKEDVKVQNA